MATLENKFGLGSGGGSDAYITGDEIAIAASTTLTAETHGGKTLEICMTAEDQAITLFSASGITTKQRRVGFKVSPQSKRVKIYNAGTSGTDQIFEVWLEPGAVGSLYATALTALGSWAWFGQGNVRNIAARSTAASVDLGGAMVAANTWYPTRSCFVTGASAFVITFAMSASASINAVVGTYNSSKVVTLGAVQTVRDTAASMLQPVIGPASGGGVVFGWWDSTNSKLEVAGATVDTGARTISVGAVVDVNTVTTNDTNAVAYISIIPDYSTANQLWMSSPMSGGSALTVMSLSGNTVTVDGDNAATGLLSTGRIYSPAANKCLTISKATIHHVNYYQYSAGAVTSQWSWYTAHDTTSGNEGILGLSPTFFLVNNRTSHHLCTTDQTAVLTSSEFDTAASFWDSSDLNLNPMHYALPVDDRSLIFISYEFTSFIRDLSNFNWTTDDATKDSRPRAVVLPKTLQHAGSSLHSFAINPTTKDVLISYTGLAAVGGNIILNVNLYEVPRN